MASRASTHRVPTRRSAGLLSRRIDAETIVFDRSSQEVGRLDGITAAVWESIDGSSDVAAIAAGTGESVEAVESVLASLDQAGLLGSPGMSRRRLLAVAGITGGVVVMGAVPAAATATSTQTVFGSSCSNSGLGGSTFTINVTGFAPGSTVTVTITYKNALGFNGTDTVTIAIPANSTTGSGSTSHGINNLVSSGTTYTLSAIGGAGHTAQAATNTFKC